MIDLKIPKRLIKENPEKLLFYGKTGNRTKFVREFFPIKCADIYDKFDGLIMYRVDSAFEPPTL